MRLSDLAVMLTKYGFPPDLSGQKHLSNKKDKSAIYRIGVSGFCFGNIMLLYLPEYLGINNSFELFKGFFVNTSLILSLPVVLYASRLYYINAWKGIRDGFFNMDIPKEPFLDARKVTPYYVQYVEEELKKIDNINYKNGGLIIHTTIDSKIQNLNMEKLHSMKFKKIVKDTQKL